MPENFGSIYFSGQGPLFIGDNDGAGGHSGLVFVGDIGELSLEPNVSTEEVIENVTGSGGIGSSFTSATEYTLSAVLRSAKPAHLAEAIQGAVTTKVAGSAAAEAVTGYHDKFTPLANVKVSNVVVNGSGGTPTYTVTDDYIVHAATGMLEIVSTGAIADGAALEVSYDYAAQKKIAAAPSNQQKFLHFGGLNRANSSKSFRGQIYKVALDPGILGLIQQGHAEIPITGRVLLDSARAADDQFFSYQAED